MSLLSVDEDRAAGTGSRYCALSLCDQAPCGAHAGPASDGLVAPRMPGFHSSANCRRTQGRIRLVEAPQEPVNWPSLSPA